MTRLDDLLNDHDFIHGDAESILSAVNCASDEAENVREYVYKLQEARKYALSLIKLIDEQILAAGLGAT